MKRQNYWKVHKNKAPKDVLSIKASAMQKLKLSKRANAIITGVMGAVEVGRINNIAKAKDDKAKEIFNALLNASKSVLKTIAYNPLETYRVTGKYGRKPKTYMPSNKTEFDEALNQIEDALTANKIFHDYGVIEVKTEHSTEK